MRTYENETKCNQNMRTFKGSSINRGFLNWTHPFIYFKTKNLYLLCCITIMLKKHIQKYFILKELVSHKSRKSLKCFIINGTPWKYDTLDFYKNVIAEGYKKYLWKLCTDHMVLLNKNEIRPACFIKHF